MLENIKTVHFIGIGGVGMSAIAYVMKKAGFTISGSDEQENRYTKRLKDEGIKIYIGHSKDNINNIDAIAVSSAIKKDNPEIIAAREKNIRVFHRSDLLAAIMNHKKGIAIAGVHGKTTTTSMLASVLVQASFDATILIGGELNVLNGNARHGASDYVLAEADESDGSFLKFLPYISVITNIENDHMDYYKTMDRMIAAFKQFIEQTNDNGYTVLCFDDSRLPCLAKNTNKRIISYAIDNVADYNAKNIVYDKTRTTYDLFYKGEFVRKMSLVVPGRHNVLNSLAVVAISRVLGIDYDCIFSAFMKFTGAKRRFEIKGNINDILIVDDYAHHPSEIKSTLKASAQVAKKRIIGIFQPHRYSRTQLLKEDFGKSFADCDIVLLTDIYAASEMPIDGVNGEMLFDEVKKNNTQNVYYTPTFQDILDFLVEKVKPGDLVITLGAGNIYLVGEEYLELLKKSLH